MGSIPVRSTKGSRLINISAVFYAFRNGIEPRFDRLRGGRAPFVVQYFVFPTFPPLSGESTRQEYQKTTNVVLHPSFFFALFRESVLGS